MNGIRRGTRSRSVLTGYLASYLGLAVFACAVLGVVIFSVTVRELNLVSESELNRRVQQVADDISAQIDVMQGVAYRVSAAPEYKPEIIKIQKYHEITMLESLSKYDGYTPLSDSYFLFYRDEDMLYLPVDRVKSNFTLYFQNTFGYADAEACGHVREAIQQIFEPLILCAPNETIMMCFPIWQGSRSRVNAFLVFTVKPDRLDKRIRLIGGGFDGEVSLYWRDARLIGGAGSGTPIAVCESDGGIRAQLILNRDSAYERIDTYRRVFWFTIISILAVIGILGIVSALNNYRPIRRLANEFANTRETGKNELVRLQQVLARNVEDRHINQNKLQTNMKWLNEQRRRNLEQYLTLAITGNLHPVIQSAANSDEFLHEDARFCVLCARVRGRWKADELFNQIAEMGDNDVALCGVPLPYESMIAVVLSLRNDADIGAITALLGELFEANGIAASLGMGSVCEALSQLPDSFASALSNIDEGNNAARSSEWYDSDTMNRLLTHIREGQADMAKQTVEQLLKQIESSSDTILIRSCAYSDVINAMLRMASRSGVDVTRERMGIVLHYNNPAEINMRVHTLTEELCLSFGSKKDEKWIARRDSVIKYVRDHICEYELCLSALESHSGFSTRQIEQIIRQETGMTFKEYVTALRMERAKQLLKMGESVTDTGRQVCYMSISYFIKTFKKTTGMTPAEYRRFIERGESSD